MRSTLHQLPTTKNSAGAKRCTPTPSCAAPLPLLLPPACSLGGVCDSRPDFDSRTFVHLKLYIIYIPGRSQFTLQHQISRTLL